MKPYLVCPHPGYDRLWAAFNANSGDRYEHYQAKTSRPVPVVVIDLAR
jgi:hypothetical protein